MELLVGLLPSFSVPDTSSWHYRLAVSGTILSIPGGTEFHKQETEFYEMANPQASSTGSTLRFTAHTPERNRWNLHFGAGVGNRVKKWQAVAINLVYANIPGADGEQKYRMDATMTAEAPVLELVAGTEYHFARRHFLGAQVMLPFQLTDGDLTYQLGETTVHSGKTPSSFREASLPRLMATYDYRFFDRIDLGFGLGWMPGDYFATIPEADIDSVGHIRLEHGNSNAVIELHLGWTFGRARP